VCMDMVCKVNHVFKQYLNFLPLILFRSVPDPMDLYFIGLQNSDP
jgi:hypothetical protein